MRCMGGLKPEAGEPDSSHRHFLWLPFLPREDPVFEIDLGTIKTQWQNLDFN